jgi:hypothetical protein
VRAFGLDVHRDFCEIAVAEDGEVRSAGRIATRVESLELFAQSLVASDVVALEATTGADKIVSLLQAQGIRVVVANTRARRDNDSDGYVLSAHPGKSQGRPRTTSSSQLISQNGLPIRVSLQQPHVPGAPMLTEGPDAVSSPDNGSKFTKFAACALFGNAAPSSPALASACPFAPRGSARLRFAR